MSLKREPKSVALSRRALLQPLSPRAFVPCGLAFARPDLESASQFNLFMRDLGASEAGTCPNQNSQSFGQAQTLSEEPETPSSFLRSHKIGRLPCSTSVSFKGLGRTPRAWQKSEEVHGLPIQDICLSRMCHLNKYPCQNQWLSCLPYRCICKQENGQSNNKTSKQGREPFLRYRSRPFP